MQLALALAVFVGLFLQRTMSRRFSSENRLCSGDVITTKLGQVGIACSIGATFAFALEALELLQVDVRYLALWFLAGQALMQVRSIYSSRTRHLRAPYSFSYGPIVGQGERPIIVRALSAGPARPPD
jgi:hypothetical protein